MHRRDFIRMGSLALEGSICTRCWQGRSSEASGLHRPISKTGGASQLDTFDPKPDAPSGYQRLLRIGSDFGLEFIFRACCRARRRASTVSP